MEQTTQTKPAEQTQTKPAEQTAQTDSANSTEPERPDPLFFCGVMLPSELKQAGRFCCWRYEYNKQRGRWQKIPYNPRTQKKAKSTNPFTFSDYDTAEEALADHGYDGLGVDILNNIGAVDIDHCYNDGKFQEWAAQIVKSMGSYCELSPSGAGVHILFTVPADFDYDESLYYKKHPDKGIEVYLPGHTNRYITLTGHHLKGYTELKECGKQVKEVLDRYMLRDSLRDSLRDNGAAEPQEPLSEPQNPLSEPQKPLSDALRAAGTDGNVDSDINAPAKAKGATNGSQNVSWGDDDAINEIIREVKQRIPITRYLTPSKGGLYNCPLCGSGTGPHHTGALQVYSETNTAFCRSCRTQLDSIEAHKAVKNCDFKTALEEMAGEIGITIEGGYKKHATDAPQTAQSAPNADSGINTPAKAKGAVNGSQSVTEDTAGTVERTADTAERTADATEEKKDCMADYMSYYNACESRLKDPAAVKYLEKRGISLETAQKCLIGFDPRSDPIAAPGGQGTPRHPEPRIICPITHGFYIARAIRPDIDPQYKSPNPKGSTATPYNLPLLESDTQETLFIVEGIFDALSLREAGEKAISLNSVSNAGKLLTALDEAADKKGGALPTLIISLDNDAAGRKAQADLLAELEQRRGIDFIAANISGDYKDPNEAWTADPQAFLTAVRAAKRRTAARPDNIADYIEAEMAGEIEAFKCNVKTGFENLDEQCGGLYSGLYVLAAISSLGKTTFVHQMADQIAAAGTDVLFFSLEQSRLELTTKSIARLTAQKDLPTAVTSLSIRKGYLPKNVRDAAKEYQQTAGKHMNIIQGDFAFDVSDIEAYTKRYIRRNETTPVLIVDYLQILRPMEIKGRQQSTKEAVDFTVTQLKRLSRNLNLTIIVICSVNRQNYETPISFESLKESGAIEYSADSIWGLQLHCLSDPKFEKKQITEKRELIKKAKAENTRQIDLVCLKNRYGISSYECSFEYFAANDFFRPTAADSTETDAHGNRVTYQMENGKKTKVTKMQEVL